MSGNTYGKIFRITTWGESHGGAVGVVVDGCPSNIEISEEDIQKELDRRKPGQNHIQTARQESDTVNILSGIVDGKTLGTPISLLVWNKDTKGKDYNELRTKFRPSHADYTYFKKYGIRDISGGGRSSARETVARVAAGAIAKKILKELYQVEIIAYVKQVFDIVANINLNKVRGKDIERNIVRCPDPKAAKKMEKLIVSTKKKGDTVGGIIGCVIKGCLPGLGEPVFDRFEAELSKSIMSIPSTKGFEIGSGFGCVYMLGSEHNDSFYSKKNKIHTKTNNSGGVQGGITNGEDIYFRVAFKPVATIFSEQKTVTISGENTVLKMEGRHDPCVLPRAVPIVESMAALVTLDFYLMGQKKKTSL